jgi:uncharacterized protein YbaR (Trm112 family)
MAVKTDCPRCKAHLQVPNKLAGGYINCPQCKGRLWVAKDAPTDATPADAIGVRSGDSAAEPVGASAMPPPGPPGSPPVRSPSGTALAPPRKPGNGPLKTPAKPAPPPAPVQKKVARLITAEAADSTLRLAADGKLPELALEESGNEKQEAKSKAVNPLVMFIALGVSIVLSAVLVLAPTGPSNAARAKQRAAMRQKIEDQYFGSDSIENKDVEPYQVLLRDAQRAYTRGDYRAAQRNYRRVLEMLREERGNLERGLTGSRTRDKELEEALSVLVSEG